MKNNLLKTLPIAVMACMLSNIAIAENNADLVIDKAAKQIDETDFIRHVEILSSDAFEGRAPSTPGGEKTVSYIEAEFKQLGLIPAFDNQTSYRQPVALIEQQVVNDPTLTINYKDGSEDALPYKTESVTWTTRVGNQADLKNSDLVFVGYGVVAPEYGWNDYAGVDMKGKTAVILVNDPGFRDAEGKKFKGNTMTYYGRWTYKYQEAAKQGAAGAIVIHQTKAAGYPWGVVAGSWTGAQYMLDAADGNQGRVAVEGWVTKQAAETIFKKSGLSFDDMVKQAGKQGFKPVPLKGSASISVVNKSKKSTSYNVGGFIKGTENPDQAFIYTGHWDHLGVKPGEKGTDTIYNGAVDNATGIAGILEMAQAFKALPTAPKRSVMFLAVTAEESGLLGSAHYAEYPSFPMSKTVAGINIDAMPPLGATDDVVVIGFGNSEMDDYLRTEASKLNRELVREPTPEKGFFYRSDHFNLAKKGVPMLYCKAGQKVRGKSEGDVQKAMTDYLANRYHKPADEVTEDWDYGGIMQDLNMFFRIGETISNSDAWPQWAAGNEFEAIRKASQKSK